LASVNTNSPEFEQKKKAKINEAQQLSNEIRAAPPFNRMQPGQAGPLANLNQSQQSVLNAQVIYFYL
jgi:hypothetical protein